MSEQTGRHEDARDNSVSPASQEVVPLQRSGHAALLFTTNPGLEDVAVEEFRERAAACGLTVTRAEAESFGLVGYVLVESAAPLETVEALGHRMRSVHHLLVPLCTFGLPPGEVLERLYDRVCSLEIPAMDDAESFRVTTVRKGTHDFTSMDVQRVAGAALQDRYGTPVDLEGYAVEVRVDVFEERCLVSLQRTREALSRRHWRVYEPHAGLKPNVAYALLRLSGLETSPEALLDPFCGSGTILLEAAACWPEAALYGSDWNEEAVAGARQNAEAEGLAGRLTLRTTDARRLTEAFPEPSVEAVITNPPYGVRVGQGMNFARFYRQFLEEAAQVLIPGGRLVLLALKRGALNHVLHRESEAFAIRHVRIVEIGGLYPGLFVLERT